MLRRRKSQKVTAGEVYRVVVRLDTRSPSSGRPDPLSESLLGFVSEHALSAGGGSGAAPVVVAALVPGGPLLRNPHVRIGDRLERVNGAPVSVASLPAVLAALPRRGKVTLTMRSGALAFSDGVGRHAAPATNGSTHQESADGAVTNLTGDGLQLEALGQLLRSVPYGLLCLSTGGLTESSPDRQDIVYQFPSYDTALLSARGSLLTLAGLTQQISGDTPLRVRTTVGGTPVHVAVTCQEELVVVLAIPESSLSALEVDQLGQELWQLLKLEFGSTRSAFCEPANRPYVDHLAALLVQRALLTAELTAGLPGALPPRQADALDRLLPAAHAIHLPRHVQVLIDDSLTELESGDFGEESEDFHGLQRLYLLRGCAFYYKGYLAGSHLAPEDQRGVQLFLRHHQLLAGARRDGWRQLVVWRRYHRPPPSAATEQDAYPCPGLTHHLLVVGSRHALLAVLLESGGCTVELSCLTGPDSIYVEEAQATLFQLESMGIMDMCESWLGGAPAATAPYDDELPGGARLFEGSSRDVLLETRWWSRLVGAGRDLVRHPKFSHDQPDRSEPAVAATADEPRPVWRLEAADSSNGDNSGDGAASEPCSHSEDGSGSTDGSAADTWEIYRGPPTSRLLPNQYDLMENKKIYMGQALEDSRRVVPDAFSLALQHVWLDVEAAAYLALPEPLLATWVRADLLAAFNSAVARLLRLLAPPAEESGLAEPPAEGAPREVGTLFSLDGQDGQTFWVVGRQMSRRQLFVCVPGSTPPDMLELAFRLSQGTGPR
ncbi:protein inturned-like [Pollicipes pollicipes]|uniref:protein inturned-like n=1 Tax=Pollicipes pollicipes TaxID=41117 RepID=UPI001884DC4F|nr:protein inturned-like [Pollicipes pollicipes]